MIKKSIVFFSGLCPIIAVTAHFAEGVIFAVGFWLLLGTSILVRFIIRTTHITQAPAFFEYFGIAAAAVFYYLLMQLLFPLFMLPLEMYIYILAVLSILTVSTAYYHTYRRTVLVPIWYTVLLLCTGLIRELCAFGTISLPAPSGLLTLTIFAFHPPLRFLGSAAGTLMMLGASLWLFRLFRKKFPIKVPNENKE